MDEVLFQNEGHLPHPSMSHFATNIIQRKAYNNEKKKKKKKKEKKKWNHRSPYVESAYFYLVIEKKMIGNVKNAYSFGQNLE